MGARNQFLLTIFLAVMIVFVQSQDTSAKIELSKEKIKLKLKNNQVLIGNRKIVSITQSYSIETKIVYEFLGIPFAKAPIDEKRFQFPQKLDRILTNDQYDATFYRPSCWQEYDLTFPGFRGSEMWNPPHNVSEDCLYLNIWVPVSVEQDNMLFKEKKSSKYSPNSFKNVNESLKSTLFWIYGGSYSSGSSNLNLSDGTILSAFENVIVVTSNYRVGPFGFMYLNTSSAPGNSGLADQVLAIEWYKENYLDMFGGSQDNICLFGESVGSMSIHFLLLTNKANIFNRGIMQSLSSYLDIGFREPDDAFRLSLDFAEKVGCLKINSDQKNLNSSQTLNLNQPKINEYSQDDLAKLQYELYQCLLKLNSSFLSQKQYELDYVNEHLKMQFLPTLDFNKLLEKNPLDYDFNEYQDKFRKHELLIGINYDEATYFTFYYYNGIYFDLKNFLKPSLRYDNQFVYERILESLRTKKAPKDKITSIEFDTVAVINVTLTSNKKNRIDEYFYKNFIKCLTDLYTYEYSKNLDTDGSEINFDLKSNEKNSQYLAWKKINKIIGDYIYNCPTIKIANKYNQMTSNKTFFYRFNKRNLQNPWPEWMGVIHGYEIEYVFGRPWVETNYFETSDRLMSQKMMNYWANFAKFGRLTSSYDRINNRSFFVEFTSLDKYKNVSEYQEFDWFNKDYLSCDLINNYLNHKQTYANKYEQCLNFHSDKMLNDYLLSNSNSKYRSTCLFAYKLFLIFVFISNCLGQFKFFL